MPTRPGRRARSKVIERSRAASELPKPRFGALERAAKGWLKEFEPRVQLGKQGVPQHLQEHRCA